MTAREKREKLFVSMAAGKFGTLMDGLGRVRVGLVVPMMNQNGGAGNEQKKGKQTYKASFGVRKFEADNDTFTRSGGKGFV